MAAIGVEETVLPSTPSSPARRVPLGLVVARIRADRHLLAVVGLLALTATILITLGPLTARAVVDAGLSRQVAEAAPVDTGVEVVGRGDPGTGPAIEAALAGITAPFDGTTVHILESSTRRFRADIADDERVITSLVALPGDGSTLLSWVDGASPSAGEAGLHRDAAAQLGLEVGATIAFDDGGPELRLVGLFEPGRASDRLWWRSGLLRDGVIDGVSFTTVGPVLVTDSELLSVEPEPERRWRILPDPDAVDAGTASTLRDWPQRVEDDLIESGLLVDGRVESGLVAFLNRVERSIEGAGLIVTAVLGLLAALAIPALIIAAGLLLDSRRVETAMLVGRGLSRRQLAVAAVIETGLIVTVVAVLALPAALLVPAGLNRFGSELFGGLRLEGRVTGPVLAATGAGLVLSVAVLASQLASRRTYAEARALGSRNETRPWLQRTGFDLLIIALCGLGLWQLRRNGLGDDGGRVSGVDPVVIVAPALTVAAGALVALRAIGTVATTGAVMAERARSLATPLALRAIGRNPAGTIRATLLVLLAVAVAGFTLIHGTTWTRSQADQADAEVGVDVRAEVGTGAGHLPFGYLAPAYAEAGGVTAAAVAVRGEAAIGPLDVDVLLTDAAALPGMSRARADRNGELASMASRLVVGDGLGSPLDRTPPDRVGALELDVAARSTGPIETAGSVEITATVQDGQGHISSIIGSPVTIDGGPTTVVFAFERDLEGIGPVRLPPPLSLVEIEIAMPAGIQVELPPPEPPDPDEEREATEAETEEEAATTSSTTPEVRFEQIPTAVELTMEGWRLDGEVTVVDVDLEWGTVLGLAQQLVPSTVSATPGEDQILFLNGGVSRAVGNRARFRFPVAGDGSPPAPVPVAVTDSVLAEQGLAIGDEVLLDLEGAEFEVEIIGTLPLVPTLHRSRLAVLADLGVVGRAAIRSGQPVPKPRTVLAATDGSIRPSTELTEAPYLSSEVLDRDERAEQLRRDPVQLGVVISLAIGLVGAAVSALVGLVANTIIGARRRVADDAVLRALGAPLGLIRRLLVLEAMIIVGVSVSIGLGVALLTASLVLPTLAVDSEGRQAVPEPQLVVPWSWLATIAAVAAVAVIVIPLLVERVLSRGRPSSILRLGDGQ